MPKRRRLVNARDFKRVFRAWPKIPKDPYVRKSLDELVALRKRIQGLNSLENSRKLAASEREMRGDLERCALAIVKDLAPKMPKEKK